MLLAAFLHVSKELLTDWRDSSKMEILITNINISIISIIIFAHVQKEASCRFSRQNRVK